MTTEKFVYWQEGDFWLGYFLDYPDYVTQGVSFGDLQDHLRDLYKDLTSGAIPNIRKLADLEIV